MTYGKEYFEDKKNLEIIYNRLIDILYSILGNFENCEKTGDFIPFYIQCNRVYIQTIGLYEISDVKRMFEISAILIGMPKAENLTHAQVKSLIFHCINIISKLLGDKNE